MLEGLSLTGGNAIHLVSAMRVSVVADFRHVRRQVAELGSAGEFRTVQQVGLASLKNGELPQYASLGNLALLGLPKLALFCSRRCPGALVLRTYDLVGGLRAAPISLVGGFHSPMEQECLRLVLRAAGGVIVCPARGIEGMRAKAEWKEPLERGQLLVLSPFSAYERRVTHELAERRNAFVAEVADALFVAYATPGGSTERIARAALLAGKPVFTFAGDSGTELVELGARAVTDASEILEAMALLQPGTVPAPDQQNTRARQPTLDALLESESLAAPADAPTSTAGSPRFS